MRRRKKAGAGGYGGNTGATRSLCAPVAAWAIFTTSIATPRIRATEPAEAVLTNLPVGVVLESSDRISDEQGRAIGAKLGGEIVRLSNSTLRVHGRRIQLNAVTAADEASAKRILDAMKKTPPFALREGAVVFEYANPRGGPAIDAALALKTSFELGLVPKPERVRYEIGIEVAAVEEADYMACNPLFNAFLAQSNGEAGAREDVEKLAKRFSFGESLVLRRPNPGGAILAMDPEPAKQENVGDGSVRFRFEKLPQRNGVPYVRAKISVAADAGGLAKTVEAPGAALVGATNFWPADDLEIKALAAKITAGCAGDRAKAEAILAWLTPGKNLRYGGETGSRWGVEKVFEQKFGHCWDFSDCFVTLCRAAGVPSRQVAGWLFGASGHVWAEYYEDGVGWRQVDPTGGGALACGIYHIPWFTTDDGEMPIVYLSIPEIRLHLPR